MLPPRLFDAPLALRCPAAAKRISRLAGVPPAVLRRLLFLLPPAACRTANPGATRA
jgi:hypothetical protein